MNCVVAKWPKELEGLFRVIGQIAGRVRLLTADGFFLQADMRDRGVVHLDLSGINFVPGADQYVRGIYGDGSSFDVRGVVNETGTFIIEALEICDVPIGEEDVSSISGPESREFTDEEIARLNQELQA